MDLKVKLSKPLKLGDVTHEVVDLSKLEGMTGADVLFCEKEADRKGGQAVALGPYDQQFQIEMAARASGIDPAALVKMNPRDFYAVRRAVRDFFIGTESEEEPKPPQE